MKRTSGQLNKNRCEELKVINHGRTLYTLALSIFTLLFITSYCIDYLDSEPIAYEKYLT